MRPAVVTFAEEIVRALPIKDPVVEIGARRVEGETHPDAIRRLFADCEYIGCDLEAGLGVDRVEDVHELSFADESVGTILCLDTLEHVADPLRAVKEMYRVLKPDGVVALSSVMFFPIHAYPWDYWRFTPEGFEKLLEPFATRLVLHQGYEYLPETVLGVGLKGSERKLVPDLFPETNRVARRWGEHLRVDLGPIRMSLRALWRLTLAETWKAVPRKARARARGGRPSPS